MVTTILAGVIWFLVVLMVAASVVPLSKVPMGFVRGLAFPREQWFGLSLLLMIAAPMVMEGCPMWVILALLTIVAFVQLIYIAKFTFLWPKQSVAATGDLAQDASRHISLIAANVKLSNRAYERLIGVVQAQSPDIVMAIEVDEDWIDALETSLGDDFEHWVKVPQDNGYGVCVMSRLPLSQVEVRELIVDKVPSVRAIVTLRSGDKTRLYVVHPEPPTLTHDTKGRDSEIALIGIEADDDELPAIVSGDLNDVAWSTTTRRFQRLSGLLDPRVGRGFYNTFSANLPIMRWPLDHLFHDARFQLIEMKRLDKIGSDHFPMLFRLALAPDEKAENDIEESDAEEEAEVREMIDEEKKRDREAIGSDWEDED